MTDLEVSLLIRLVETGQCKDAKRSAALLHRFRQAKWIELSTRVNTWLLRPEAIDALTKRLDHLRPGWRADILLLRQGGLDPLDPNSLPAVVGLRATPHVAEFVHRKTWNAATAAGSKVPSRLPSSATVTDDWSLRGRVNCATLLVTQSAEVNLGEMTANLTEFAIPDRAWRLAEGLRGELPKLILTVENIGALVDLHLPPSTMVLYSQGTAYKAAVEVLNTVPDAQWMHFGDLDPAGVTIARRMARLTDRPLRIYVPSFAMEYLHRALLLKKGWRAGSTDHPVLAALAKANAWLEQEFFLLDRRIASDLGDAAY